jgi:hypothetical protein
VVLQDRDTGAIAKEIEFDVAVTVIEGTQTKGGIGVFVGPIGIGSQGQSNVSNQSILKSGRGASFPEITQRGCQVVIYLLLRRQGRRKKNLPFGS